MALRAFHALREALAWKSRPSSLPATHRAHVIDAIAEHDVAVAIKPVKADQLKELVVTLLGGSKAI
jgi:hypothetical protein